MSTDVVYSAGGLRIGSFRARLTDRHFADSGPTRGHLLVFPREAVAIQHAGRRELVADPTVIMVYNRGQLYRRGPIAPAGDRCAWFAFDADAILEARGDLHGDRERPFGELMMLPADPRSTLLSRLAFSHATSSNADSLCVEEVAATLLAQVVGAGAPPPVSRSHAELADATRRLLVRRVATRWSLDAIAGELGVSAFHLARVFRAATGHTIHAHRTHLRLCAALERIGDATDLAALGLELGFSSHSHFTSAFRVAFGVTPSHVRRDPRGVIARLRARS